MNEDEIRVILGEHIDFEAWMGEFHIEGKITGLDAAVKAIAVLLKPQPVNQTISVLFDELHDALEDVQLCDNTAGEAKRAWGEIAGIVEGFKGKAAKLVDEQPVDKVRAMAVLTCRSSVRYPGYCVPGGEGVIHHVYILPDRNECMIHVTGGMMDCAESTRDKPCDHIRAVEMYRTLQHLGPGKSEE